LDGSSELSQTCIGLGLPCHVFIEELLSEVVRNTGCAALDTLIASRLSWLSKAFDLVLFTFCTWC
jgi:hypothetical protein